MASIPPVLIAAIILVVGREGVLASADTRELRCGQKLVSGLYTKPQLPLGYSYVTTVPRGACRLNISEVVPSDNYLALKVTNGSYIMNGEFAVSAPGTYEAAGARFLYTRTAKLDNVYAHGPIQHPIDIMILYTKPNPNIKYEFLTNSDPEDTNEIPSASHMPSHHTEPRHHRHHDIETYMKDLSNPQFDTPPKRPDFRTLDSQSQVESNVIGDRKFVWRILSFTQCSRSCGGGLQIGKFKCAEVTSRGEREVPSAYCSGAPPAARRRRCGVAPCAPRWRAAAWSACPVCGPAQKTRIVGCVQDHARGITKISDSKCPLPKPPTSEACDIANCASSTVPLESPRIDTRRQVRPKDRIDAFHEGPVISVARNYSIDKDLTPTMSPNFNFNAAGGWLYTEWSECVGWCVGGGVQSRGVRCADPSGCKSKAPPSTQSCAIRKQCNSQWFTSEWSPCSAQCDGRQVRGVICVGGSGRRLRDGACRLPKPDIERACGGACSPSWYMSDWGTCEGPCEAGVQSRTVWCARGGAAGAEGAARDVECPGVRPTARRTCVPQRCSTRPVLRPAPVNPPAVGDLQQRVTRHQSGNHNQNTSRDVTPSGACVDKINICVLAVQARLCHYPYYAENCCHACHGRS